MSTSKWVPAREGRYGEARSGRNDGNPAGKTRPGKPFRSPEAPAACAGAVASALGSNLTQHAQELVQLERLGQEGRRIVDPRDLSS